MPILVSCPGCSSRLKSPDSAAGKLIKCPKCGGRVKVPGPALEVTGEAEPEKPAGVRPVRRVATSAARADADSPPSDSSRPTGLRDVRQKDKDQRPGPRPGKAQAGSQRTWVLALIGVGSLVLLLAIGGGIWWLTRTKPTPVVTGLGPSAPTKDRPKGNGRPGVLPAPSKPEDTAKVLAPAKRIQGSFGVIAAVWLNADGSRAVVANDASMQRAAYQIWELKPVPKKIREFPGMVFAVSPGWERLVRQGAPSSPEREVVDLETGTVVAKFKSTGLQECYFRSPDSLIIVRPGYKETDGADKAGWLIVREYDVAAKQEAGLVEIAGDNSAKSALVNCGRELFIGRPKTSRVEVWDLATRKQVRDLNLAGLRASDRWEWFLVSSDGKWVAAVPSATGRPEIFDGLSGAVVGPSGSAEHFPAFVPGRNLLMGGRSVILTSPPGGVRDGIWAYDIDRRTITACLPGRGYKMAFSADGRTAASWQLFKQTDIQLWDLTQVP